ncbi:MAG: transposase [Candidatus Hydrogenedentes bacterium]|nr:transposase [Candidatus Hydrogenedentota bacterium]
MRKSEEAIRQAHRKLRRRESKNGQKLRAQTLVYAEYIIVFTTFPEEKFPPSVVMEWYRIRWQIELVFKRFKQIAKLGHLPKHDDESARQ